MPRLLMRAAIQWHAVSVVYKQLFAEGQEFSYDLTDIGTYYRDYIDLMTHWDARITRADTPSKQ